MDRQWSNKLECYVAQARRVVMAYGSAGAHREELKEKQLLLLRTELRSYRLNGSGMNKIIRSTSAILVHAVGGAVTIPRAFLAAAHMVIGCLVARAITAPIVTGFASHWPVFLGVVALSVAASATIG